MNRASLVGAFLVSFALSAGFGPSDSGEGLSAVWPTARAQAAAAENVVSAAGIPAGMEEIYRLGMNPQTSDVPVMYTIHPCPHCVHLKDFLDRNGVRFVQVYVDDFTGPARDALMDKVRTYDNRASFPTLVTPDGRSVVGFREKAVKRLLGMN